MIVLGLLLALTTSPATPNADPLAPARSGRLQCYWPDHARKTCRSIFAYRPTGGNTYLSTATSLIGETGDITIESDIPVRVVSGGVCSVLGPEVFEGARYMRGGARLSDDDARPIMAMLEGPTWTLFGKEFCTRYLTIGGGLVGIVAVDGIAASQIGQPVAWISPDDGYRLAPEPAAN